MKNHLHIVSFNVPYPPDYGGVIDVYYKIKSLKDEGIRVSLHCFTYDRKESQELENICHKIYYYPRKTGFRSQWSTKPYIVYSRRSDDLLNNLKKDSDPVLFEGIHSSYYLNHKELRNRLKILRAHNIEHRYYFKLFQAERNITRKIYLFVESGKLLLYQKHLKYADYIAAISTSEERYFRNKFRNVFLMNAFHSSEKVNIHPGKGKYLLYHGNLGVAENNKAAHYLIDHVFNKLKYPVMIAGKNPSTPLIRKTDKYSNIDIIASPGKEKMKELIQNAHATILVSFQDTGIKLKLLESLFNGRFCIANRLVTGESELKELCEIGNTASELVIQIKRILSEEFTDSHINIRKQALASFENRKNTRLLIRKINTYSNQ